MSKDKISVRYTVQPGLEHPGAAHEAGEYLIAFARSLARADARRDLRAISKKKSQQETDSFTDEASNKRESHAKSSPICNK